MSVEGMTVARPRRVGASARKRRRLYAVLAGLVMLGVATALMLAAFEDNITYFYSPSDLAAQAATPEHNFRLGGLVATGSVERLDRGMTTRFDITDGAHSRSVSYTGILPDLFREGQGVVTEGRLDPDGVFIAREVLAKHDENYMPREVVDALKKSGQWEDGGMKSGAGAVAPGEAGSGGAAPGQPALGTATQ